MKRNVWLLLTLLGILNLQDIFSSVDSHQFVTVTVGKSSSDKPWPPIWFPTGPTDENG